MSILGPLSATLEVPDIEPGLSFYGDAGLEGRVEGSVARFRCFGQEQDCLVLIGGAERKKLHHIAMRARLDDALPRRIAEQGGTMINAPEGFDPSGAWLVDPHGMRVHLVEAPAAPPQAPCTPFEINAPGRLVRRSRSAMQPLIATSPPRPLKLGHILLFSPDVMASVAFFTLALGMGLADRAQDVIAFLCARHDSDHHVVAFAKSPGIGFHHASFQVEDPDVVGRGGRALVGKAGRGDWGFGRHTIGSNFFHYIQDPWGSWFEYYSDMDYIEDHAAWNPTNYGMEDSLANWGPPVPADFVHNYEVDQAFA